MRAYRRGRMRDGSLAVDVQAAAVEGFAVVLLKVFAIERDVGPQIARLIRVHRRAADATDEQPRCGQRLIAEHLRSQSPRGAAGLRW